PVAIRYPRGAVTDSRENDELQDIPVGKSEVLCEGQDILIIAAGNTVSPSVDAAGLLKEADINACVINARFIKPLDMDLISARAREIKYVLTVEENAVSGGFGSAVLEKLAEAGVERMKFKMLGIPDEFIEQGPQSLLRQKLGLDAEGIARDALTLVRSIHHA
ncbi:MAG TPA: 1-deoxy-D-xylulose-5-phosphate synthase, partial [Nitrospirae bacterium]|nr:1-deoxy-D-xylulose-5-phosphate synthase [Nitrospirota bacterium]